MLACLGWPAGRLAAAIIGEVAIVGLAAGAAAAVAAVPLSHAAGVLIPLSRALLAVPVGLGLAVLAAAVPAISAARSRPAASLEPAVLPAVTAHRQRSLVGLAASNLLRVPGRTLLGALALAVGVCALSVVIAVIVEFRNAVVGSLLGEAVSVRVRSVDVFAAAATVLLGLVAVADVLYINIRERSAELAALLAVGCTDRLLARMIGYEGLGMGALGSLLGAAAGMAGVGVLVGRITTELVVLAVCTAVGATALAGIAAVIPAQFLRRLPLARLLAEE